MPPEVRQHLIKSLLKHLPEPSSPIVLAARSDQPRPTPIRTNGMRKSPSKHVYNPSITFVLELSTLLASRDKPSIALLGETVGDALQTVVRDAPNVEPLLLSRAIFYLFSLMNASQELLDQPLLKTPVILHTISGFEQTILERVADLTLRGLALCLQNRTPLRSEVINTPDFWLILEHLHSTPTAAAAVFAIVEDIAASVPITVTADNYIATISLLNSFATAGSIDVATEQQAPKRLQAQPRERKYQKGQDVTPKPPNGQEKDTVLRGYKAVILISQLVQRVPELINHSQLDREEAWMTYWPPIFQNLQAQCLNPSRKIRRQACSSLQNALLSPNLSPSTNEEWTLIFQTVLFGLIARLLKPEVHQMDPVGMNETRLQAANLLCRTFLHHLHLLSQKDDLLALWLSILDVMDRLMMSGQGDNLEEAIPESLKNILLVMAGTEILAPPAKGEQPSPLWAETH